MDRNETLIRYNEQHEAGGRWKGSGAWEGGHTMVLEVADLRGVGVVERAGPMVVPAHLVRPRAHRRQLPARRLRQQRLHRRRRLLRQVLLHTTGGAPPSEFTNSGTSKATPLCSALRFDLGMPGGGTGRDLGDLADHYVALLAPGVGAGRGEEEEDDDEREQEQRPLAGRGRHLSPSALGSLLPPLLRYLCRDDRTELKRQLLCPFLRVFMAQSRFFWAEYLVLDFEPGPDQEGRMASCGFRPSVPFSFLFFSQKVSGV